MPTLLERLRLARDAYERESRPDVKRQIGELLEQLLEHRRQLPLLWFEPHAAQLDFIEARTPVVAAFAGNRFGKSTVLTVCALREALGERDLPEVLRDTKRFRAPTNGWILCPTEDKIFEPGGFKDSFEKWLPHGALLGGSWRKAFNGSRLTLSFANGSQIGFKTYKQDPGDLGGASLHWVGYDEPPPRKHREESRVRTWDHGGYEMFAMTPLDSNTAYVRREIWKKRESPDITVVRGSVYDNPTLNRAAIARALGDQTDLWRRAREFGDFVDVGGLIYPDFERCVLKEGDARLVARDGRFTLDPEFIRELDVVVSIDPGIRNAGFSWVGFDRDLTAYLFEEGLLQDRIASDYAAFIREQNSRWGLREQQISYVVDPAAKQRAQANGMTVLAALNQHEIFPNLGQNDQQLGFGQMRARMQRGRLLVGPNCVLHRDQADDYAAKEPGEGQDDSHLVPIEVGAHCLASLRYAVLERFWDQSMEDDAPNRQLGWSPGDAVRPSAFPGPRSEPLPMGFMS